MANSKNAQLQVMFFFYLEASDFRRYSFRCYSVAKKLTWWLGHCSISKTHRAKFASFLSYIHLFLRSFPEVLAVILNESICMRYLVLHICKVRKDSHYLFFSFVSAIQPIIIVWLQSENLGYAIIWNVFDKDFGGSPEAGVNTKWTKVWPLDLDEMEDRINDSKKSSIYNCFWGTLCHRKLRWKIKSQPCSI